MADLVDGFCHRCGKPVGKVSWDAADFVFHPACQKAEEVYDAVLSRPSRYALRDLTTT